MRHLGLALGCAAALCAAALLPAAATAAGGFQTFTTPSGNIGCAMDRQFARCDVWRHSWKAPPKPRGCRLDWGQGMYVFTKGRGRFVCAGDTTINPRAAVLGYGRSRRAGRFTCTSRRSGMTCSHSGSGHGFTVSRTSYRAF